MVKSKLPNLRLPGALLLLVICTCLGGCDTVRFYQKEKLSGPLMTFGESPAEAHFRAKCIYSREGAVGGVGSSAGGGCGCY